MSEKKPEAFQFPTADVHETDAAPAEPVVQEPSEAAIDQGVAESFPASDPVSVSVTKIVRKDDGEDPVEEDRAGAT